MNKIFMIIIDIDNILMPRGRIISLNFQSNRKIRNEKGNA
jgi:hypothetical protein